MDGVHMKNVRLDAPDRFEFQACRLIAKSEQPKGGKVDDLMYGSLEQHVDADFEKEKVEFKLRGKYQMVAAHTGGSSVVKFRFDWADKDPNYATQPSEPFVTFRPAPRPPSASLDYSVQVAVEDPLTYPKSKHHKISVAYMGWMGPDAIEFRWLYRKTAASPWQAFDDDDTLALQSEMETSLPAARMSSKRFLADALEYVQVVIAVVNGAALASVEVLIFAPGDDKTIMPSQAMCIEKKPAGRWAPLQSK
jgi:hypothetical protein